MARNRRLAHLLPLLLAGAAACSTKDIFRPIGTLGMQVMDPGLTLQGAATPGPQIGAWTFQAASAEVQGMGNYSFIGSAPCKFVQSAFGTSSVTSRCGGSSLVLDAGHSWTLNSVRLVVSHMELRRAWRPDLPPTGDYDGDGIANSADNCPIIYNPDQDPVCFSADPLTGSLLRDQDGDGISDAADDCIWTPNKDQKDSDGDGIGDACEQVAQVLLPQGYLTLNFGALEFDLPKNGSKSVVVNFDSARAVHCDPAFSICSIDPQAVKVEIK